MIEIKVNQEHVKIEAKGQANDIFCESVNIFKSLLNILDREIFMGASIIVLKMLSDEISAGNTKPKKSTTINYLSILNKIMEKNNEHNS